MAENLWAILKQATKQGIEDAKRDIREHEIKKHPEKECWNERGWQLEEYHRDLMSLIFGGLAAAPLLTTLSSFAYESGSNYTGNITGLGAIAATCCMWHTYRKLRNNPLYNEK
jgi:hypothetical protein